MTPVVYQLCLTIWYPFNIFINVTNLTFFTLYTTVAKLNIKKSSPFDWSIWKNFASWQKWAQDVEKPIRQEKKFLDLGKQQQQQQKKTTGLY